MQQHFIVNRVSSLCSFSLSIWIKTNSGKSPDIQPFEIYFYLWTKDDIVHIDITYLVNDLSNISLIAIIALVLPNRGWYARPNFVFIFLKLWLSLCPRLWRKADMFQYGTGTCRSRLLSRYMRNLWCTHLYEKKQVIKLRWSARRL